MKLTIEIKSVLMRYETYYRIFINGELMDTSNTKKALEEAGTSYLRRKCVLPLKFIEDDEFFFQFEDAAEVEDQDDFDIMSEPFYSLKKDVLIRAINKGQIKILELDDSKDIV
ncbi:hypothetical protein HB912_06060 [Listeria aquatica]|uniref:Uncharacterized protein n=1 Tax=Listeria aquatica TaxID=1494960 RepID=A0A841ZPF3_9LIST|nr:hypothetical protein [Listeria aquatica]MBC1521204.1 hypothetical protein [Listeria aquatica]